MSETDRPDAPAHTPERIQAAAADETAAYEGEADRPLAAVLATMGTYLAATAGVAAVVRRRPQLPERMWPGDLALVTVATHNLARLVAKDPVTRSLRAPLPTFAGTPGPAELQGKVRGTGVRKAAGALVTCSFCLGLWVTTGFGSGLILASRATRWAASILTALTGADVFQLAYATPGAEERVVRAAAR
jgi:hypothetical protein